MDTIRLLHPIIEIPWNIAEYTMYPPYAKAKADMENPNLMAILKGLSEYAIIVSLASFQSLPKV